MIFEMYNNSGIYYLDKEKGKDKIYKIIEQSIPTKIEKLISEKSFAHPQSGTYYFYINKYKLRLTWTLDDINNFLSFIDKIITAKENLLLTLDDEGIYTYIAALPVGKNDVRMVFLDRKEIECRKADTRYKDPELENTVVVNDFIIGKYELIRQLNYELDDIYSRNMYFISDEYKKDCKKKWEAVCQEYTLCTFKEYSLKFNKHLENIGKYYVAFYKITEDAQWQSKRLYLPFEECEKYCKEQNYAKYDIKDLDKMDAVELHLLTDVVDFNGNYYLPGEKIPYPTSTSLELGKFQSSIIWDKDDACDEQDFEEIYKGIEQLWTTVTTSFILPDKTIEVGIVAQIFLEDYPKFLEKLAKNNQAVYHNEEYYPFKWLCWVADNSIRLIHQDYRENKAKTEFDVIIDKDWFLHFSQNLIKSMEHYSEAELNQYNKYVNEKYKKNCR